MSDRGSLRRGAPIAPRVLFVTPSSLSFAGTLAGIFLPGCVPATTQQLPSNCPGNG